jgi:hypothetical protein
MVINVRFLRPGMNTLDLEPLAKDVSFQSDMMWVELGDGRGLHWESIGEDISVRGLLLGRADISLSKTGRTKRAA